MSDMGLFTFGRGGQNNSCENKTKCNREEGKEVKDSPGVGWADLTIASSGVENATLVSL